MPYQVPLVLPMEWVCLAFHISGLLATTGLMISKIRELLYRDSIISKAVLGLCVLVTVGELAVLVDRVIYHDPIAGGIGDFCATFGILFYLLFQIYVFERFRSYTSIHQGYTRALYIATGCMFVGFGTPMVFDYFNFVATDPDFFLLKWYSNARIGKSSQRIDILSEEKAKPEQLAQLKQTKTYLIVLGALILFNDVIGIVTQVYSITPSLYGYSYNIYRCFSLTSQAAILYHLAFGLSYLSLMAQLRAKPTKGSKSQLITPNTAV